MPRNVLQFIRMGGLLGALLLSSGATAQEPPPPGDDLDLLEVAPGEPLPPADVPPPSTAAPPPATVVPAPPDVPPPPPGAPRANLEVPPQTPPPAGAPPPPIPPGTTATTVDGHLREGAFLSSPGSLTFILHHTLLGAASGFVTMGIPNHFHWEPGTREAMAIGTIVGAGLGFGASTWWQFNHWVGLPAAEFSIVNSVLGSMLFIGLGNIISHDRTFMAWSGFVGAELGAWLTTILTTGELPLNDGLFMASGGFWAMAFGGLILAIVGNSGTKVTGDAIADVLLITPGLGAAAAALATLRWHPSTPQVLRADAFGAGIGGAVLLITGLLLGFNSPTPYILSLVSSAAAITAVSIFWEESAERSVRLPISGQTEQKRYASLW